MRSDVSASVVESLDDAVVVIDDGRVIVAWNAAMAQVTGCARADALGHLVDEALVVVEVDPRSRVRGGAARCGVVGGAHDRDG